MSFAACDQHPERDASFRCEGCGKALCGECVKESHALILCALCGERALPLDQSRPATVKELKRQEAIERPYSLGEAFFYPFRGLGLYGYIATLVSWAFVSWIVAYSFGCGGWVLAFLFASLLIGLQFKIARTSAEGDTQLPDWPEYFAIRERIGDLLVYLWIAILQFALPVAYVSALGAERLTQPNLAYWIGFAFFWWLGTAMSIMALGAAAKYGGGAALRVDLHLKGFLAAGADAWTVANLTFVLGLGVLIVRALMSSVPLIGAAASGALGAYWLFTSAHLVGVVFRRHLLALDSLYD